MYDMHYNLLTILYFNLKAQNPLGDPEKLIQDCIKIYHNNGIKGGIVNLHFETPAEMKEKFGIDGNELKNIKEMFKESTNYFESLKATGVIPNGEFIYGIEGCDFIKNANELGDLYNIGLRSITPVWDNKNNFGSGIRTESGITQPGISLIRKAISLNMIVDVSHANPKTFYGILDVCHRSRLNGEDVNLIASHSNVKTLCDRDKNLTDVQLHSIEENNGYIGLFTNENYLSLNKNLSDDEKIECYLKHLDYLLNVIEFSPDRIITSTGGLNACSYEDISKVLRDAITSKYNEELANKVLVENAKRLVRKVR